MSPDASDLAAALAPGPESHQAFARIYDRHAPVVRALCRRHCPTEAETDDALQETFIRAYRMLERVENAEGLRSWLYQIAQHVCSERRRAAGRRRKYELGSAEDGHAPMNGQLRLGQAPIDSAEKREQLDRLSVALNQLPDEERLAIHLYYLDPDPVLAAGTAIGVSRSGFYKLLARARERLASIMTRTAT